MSRGSRRSQKTRREVLRDAAVLGVARQPRRSMRGAEAPEKPNILLVLPDQHRHDAIGAAGDPVVATPTLDRLAREGTLFSRMWCQGPSCRPARASLITARYPYQHGIVGPDAPANDPAWPTVMKRLQSAGYATATFGKTDYGFKDNTGRSVPEGDRGREGGPRVGDRRRRARDASLHPLLRLDYASENPSQLDIAIPGYGSSYTDYLRAHGLSTPSAVSAGSLARHHRRSTQGFVNELAQEHDLASFVAREVISWLEARGATAPKPFFITFAPNKPHHPYGADPSGPPTTKARRCRAGRAIAWRRPTRCGPRCSRSATGSFPPEAITRRVRRQQPAHVLRRHLAGRPEGRRDPRSARGRGELDSTWVLYSSDHGELMGDHGLFDKTLFYHASVGVPGIVRPPAAGPRRSRSAGGERPSALPSRRSISPPPSSTSPAPRRSTLRDGRCCPRCAARSRRATPSRRWRARRTRYFVGVTDGRYRYTVEQRSKTPCELFDLEEDPQEIANLAEDPARAKRSPRCRAT